MTTSPPIVLWMQSLSDQTRGRLLRLVERAELTVAELCSVVQLPQSTVSRHLKVLIDDGWLTSRRDGTNNFYRMSGDQLEASRRRLWNLVREQAINAIIMSQDDARLEQVLVERRSRSQAFFSSAAGQWDRLRTELFGGRVDSWALAAMLDPTAIVGDLGCGTGSIAQTIAPWVQRVVGIDSSAAMLQAAKRRIKEPTNIDLRRGELTSMPVASGELSLALLILVLPYAEQPVKILAEAARATRSGGRLVIVDMQSHQRAEYREELGHTWLGFTRNEIEDWLTATGWHLLRYVELPPDSEAKGPGLFAVTATRKDPSDSVLGKSEEIELIERN
ncbi:MAG: metalloregulator ArsR/SmtB family transcription factor [Pirellulaceae bacterium]|nr:metalloregulator ArsR/SmtB family transcription factor [Pirellulaceae bacterium]